jgi:DNA-binding transcriptional LysR family regulator
MNLTFKQLEAFFFSAKLQSFSAAAVKLHTTQSAISKRLAELEDMLGAPVLHRKPKGLEITQAGRRLLPLAEETLRLRLRIETEVSVGQPLEGTFRIGVTELIALTWLTSFIKRLQLLHPKLMLEPVVDAGLHLFQSLESHKIDLAIMPGTYWGKQFTSVKVAQVEDFWMASPSLKMPRRPLKPEEFALYPVLEQSTGAAKNKFYEAWLAQHGFKFNKVFATNSTTVLRELTISGFGISQMALEYMQPDIDKGLLRVVRSDPMPPPMVYSAVYHSDNFSPAVETIVQLAIETCDFSRRSGIHEKGEAPGGRRAGSKPMR